MAYASKHTSRWADLSDEESDLSAKPPPGQLARSEPTHGRRGVDPRESAISGEDKDDDCVDAYCGNLLSESWYDNSGSPFGGLPPLFLVVSDDPSSWPLVEIRGGQPYPCMEHMVMTQPEDTTSPMLGHGLRVGKKTRRKKGLAAPDPIPPIIDGSQTTVWVDNIPHEYNQDDILRLLALHSFYPDFLYMPRDFRNWEVIGYAIVNFETHEKARRFFDNISELLDKNLSLSWAKPLQGKKAHVDRFRNSPVNHETVPVEYKPILFENGERVAFPPPMGNIKAPPAGRRRR